MHLAFRHFEPDDPFGEGVQGKIAALTDIAAGMEAVSFLADDNGAGNDCLAAEPFDAAEFRFGIATVAAAALTDFMRHDKLL